MENDKGARETSTLTRLVAQVVSDLVAKKGYSQTQVGNIVGRSQVYAGLRLRGLKPWNMDDLETLAPKLGCLNAFEIMDKARGLRHNSNEE